jgi:Nif-specific regulatory protein
MLGSILSHDPQENGLAFIQRELRVVQLLLEISQALNQSLDPERALQPVLQKMAEHLGMMKGSITILNRGTHETEIDLAFGLSSEERSRIRYGANGGFTGRVVETGIPVLVERTSQELHFLNRRHFHMEGMDWRPKNEVAFICVPIPGRDEIIGAISVDRLFPEEVSIDEDVRLLTTIASLLAQAIEIRREAREKMRIVLEEKERIQRDLLAHLKPPNVIGNSHAIRKVLQLINQVSCSQASVLITGECGVGKELVAQTIHINSPRADKPFVKVTLAALHERTIESELFGRGQGPLTGLIRKGCLEMAEGGTLFLDEVALLPMPVQVQLLRVLQEREFERPGSGESVRVDVRIISATSRKLEELVQKSQFRSDLFYRMNVFPIFVPPLRERKTDIPLLLHFLLERAGRKHGKTIRRLSPPALDLLMNYQWPGNVRELEDCIERAVLLSTDGVIRGCHLPPALQIADANDPLRRERLKTALAELEKEMIVDALMSVRGDAAQAARFLGVSGRLMRRRVKKFGIDSKRLK